MSVGEGERNLLPEPLGEFVVAGRGFRRFRYNDNCYRSACDYISGLLAGRGRGLDDVRRFLYPRGDGLSEFTREQFLRFSNGCRWNADCDPWVLVGRDFLVFHQTYFSYGSGPAYAHLDAEPWTEAGEPHRGRNLILEQLAKGSWMPEIGSGLKHAVISYWPNKAFRLTPEQLLRPTEELYSRMLDSDMALVTEDAVIGFALSFGYIMGGCRVTDDIPMAPEDAWGFSSYDTEHRHTWFLPGGEVPDEGRLAAAVSEAMARMHGDGWRPPRALYLAPMDMDFVLLVVDDGDPRYDTDSCLRYIQPLVAAQVLVIGIDDYRRHLCFCQLIPIYPCGDAGNEGA